MPGIIFSKGTHSDAPLRQAFLHQLPDIPDGLNLLVTFDLHELVEVPDILFGQRVLLLNACGSLVSIGPLHIPGSSACFSCLYHWIAIATFDRKHHPRPPQQAQTRLAVELLTEVIAEYTKAGGVPALGTTIRAVDTSTGRHYAHPIRPLSDCQTCGGVDSPAWPSLRIHCSPLTGIVQKMEITERPTAGAYRATATWASPRPLPGKRPLLGRQESHGRGATREQAELGCIGEAIERYSLIYRGDEPLVRARVGEIDGIDPRDILLYSENQYRRRKQWNREADERYFVGEVFDPSQLIDWFPAVDLVHGHTTFVPAACTLMWYSFSDNEPEFARADTIGCGSGWTFDDALAHALLEWIERDAMAIWWYNRIRRPSVRIDSFDMPELRQVADDLRQINRDLVLLDCTTDVGIPTYVSVAARLDGSEPLFAGAAHPSPRIAAWRAASEVGQLWFTIVRSKSISLEMSRWLANSTAAHPYMIPSHEIEASAEPLPMNPFEQVKFITDRLQESGLHPCAANQSRSDVVLKTVRAVVPGLRHVWNRRGPGRLYDVPVRLGWLDEPLDEDGLNSICCMI